MALTQVVSPFSAIGTSQDEVNSLIARADLMIIIRDIIDNNQWTLKDAASAIGTSQLLISYLKKGMIEKFSLGMLIVYLMKLGYEL